MSSIGQELRLNNRDQGLKTIVYGGPGGDDPSDPHPDDIADQQAIAIFDNLLAGGFAAAGGAVFLAVTLALQGYASPLKAGAWASFLVACAVVHLPLRTAFRARRRPETVVWSALLVAIFFVEGLAWGLGSVWLPRPEHLLGRVFTLIICLSVPVSAPTALSPSLPVFLAFFLPATLVYALWAPFSGVPVIQIGGLLMWLFIPAVAIQGVLAERRFKSQVRLRLRADALAAALKAQTDVAQTADRAKSDFLAAASHDLRQPMQALALLAGALKTMVQPGEAMRVAEQLDRSVQALGALLDALLDVSRLDAGDIRADPCAVDLAALLRRLIEEHAEEARRRGLRLRLVCSARWVWSDALLLERVVRNLISNAIRHTADGGVLVGLRRDGSRGLRIEIWDTGPGIPAQDLERIFEPYVQIGNAGRRRDRGLGLGLAIVRRLARVLQTEVTVRSWPGRGSCFSVRLPWVAPPAPSGDLAQFETVDAALVAVIDDDPDVRLAMTELLTRWGYRVVAGADRLEVCRCLEATSGSPHLIICDDRLAEEDGPAAIVGLRATFGEGIPALVISGDLAEPRGDVMAELSLPYLRKPVNPARLRALVGNLLRGGGASGPA